MYVWIPEFNWAAALKCVVARQTFRDAHQDWFKLFCLCTGWSCTFCCNQFHWDAKPDAGLLCWGENILDVCIFFLHWLWGFGFHIRDCRRISMKTSRKIAVCLQAEICSPVLVILQGFQTMFALVIKAVFYKYDSLFQPKKPIASNFVFIHLYCFHPYTNFCF